jgi:hypothetical protein
MSFEGAFYDSDKLSEVTLKVSSLELSLSRYKIHLVKLEETLRFWKRREELIKFSLINQVKVPAYTLENIPSSFDDTISLTNFTNFTTC